MSEDDWGPSDVPTRWKGYLARDGKYYNGYYGSSDYAEDHIQPELEAAFGHIKASVKEGADHRRDELTDYLEDKTSLEGRHAEGEQGMLDMIEHLKKYR